MLWCRDAWASTRRHVHGQAVWLLDQACGPQDSGLWRPLQSTSPKYEDNNLTSPVAERSAMGEQAEVTTRMLP